MAIKEWTTNYPTTQDSTPPTTEQPDLTDGSDQHRTSHVEKLRDKLDAVCKHVGDDSNLPADSLLDKMNDIDQLTTQGDLLTRDSSTEARLAVGTDGQVLIADSAQSTGLKWGSGTTLLSYAADEPADITSNSATTDTATGSVTGVSIGSTSDVVEITWQGWAEHQGTGDNIIVSLWIDDETFSGTAEVEMVMKQDSDANRSNMSITWHETGLTVATHRFDISRRATNSGGAFKGMQLAVKVFGNG